MMSWKLARSVEFERKAATTMSDVLAGTCVSVASAVVIVETVSTPGSCSVTVLALDCHHCAVCSRSSVDMCACCSDDDVSKEDGAELGRNGLGDVGGVGGVGAAGGEAGGRAGGRGGVLGGGTFGGCVGGLFGNGGGLKGGGGVNGGLEGGGDDLKCSLMYEDVVPCSYGQPFVCADLKTNSFRVSNGLMSSFVRRLSGQ